MRLKKLEIYGFKSFAERTQVTFEHGVTGIVGPNGCGKSNISDAVRWVLGEQSAKTLRGAKMEDVIFGGTEKRRRLSYCEVILTFENEDHALPIDFDEVAVARRVYRSGESEYSINRAACRLRDVVELFRDTGIGKEGYSLIGQGRIDEILSVKSEDRRQVFEEAAGIVKYKARKDEATHRMDNTRLNLTRVEDIIAELEARVEPLRLQSEAAREYLALRDELKGLELNLFVARTERYTERIQQLRQVLEGAHQAEEEARARQEALTAQRDEAEARLSELEEKAATAREQVQKLIGEVESREGAASVLRERMAASERDRARTGEQLAAARAGSGGIEAQLALLKAKIDAGRAQISAYTSEQEAAQRALSDAEVALFEREARSEKLKNESIDAMNRLSDVKSDQARLSAMRAALTSRMESLLADAQMGAAQQSDDENRVVAAQERLEVERAGKADIERLVEKAEQQVKALGEKGEALGACLAQTTAQRQETASRLKVLEEMQRDYEGYQFSVKNVLLEARRTQNSGVHGVVATLIKVPRDLERAIDVALGGALQNVVVDREEDARVMIEHLKKNRLGRATFLPLAVVRGRTLDAQEKKLLAMDGCLGVASDLIDYDPIYRNIVESLLGRTVIARDLEAGIGIMRAGRHGFRLVTLEGDVMNPGGSMTGGSVQSRMTSLLSREREVGEHREKLAQMDAQLASARAQDQSLQAERALLKQRRSELFEQLHQQDIACTREEAHLSAARAELAQEAQRTQRTGDAHAQLTSQLADVEAQLAALEGRQVGADAQREAREAEILSLKCEIALKRQENANFQRAVADGRVRLTACERDLSAHCADHDRLNRQKNDAAQLSKDSAQQLAACEATLAQGAAQLRIDEANLAQCQAALENARGAFQKVEAARVAAQALLRESGTALDAVRAALDEASERLHKGELQLSRVETEYSQMTARIWEDYEVSYEGALATRDEGFKPGDAEKRIAVLRARIKAIGSVNVAAVDEYRQTQTRFAELSAQRDDLIKAELDLQAIVDELSHKMEQQFKAEFEKLNVNFQHTFVQLFGGGQAELRLSDPKDALHCGIEIVAQPPGKKLQMLSLLSGGERALTAIAILFAMLTLKPTPFCFLDEIEAALDDANIDNFADYLRDYSAKTQFVVVTHRKGTMERCDGLYGVAMEEKGVSRIMSVRLNDAEAY
ncbi:MAG: chromosome segregation protein SMC [Clostridia bacterium]